MELCSLAGVCSCWNSARRGGLLLLELCSWGVCSCWNSARSRGSAPVGALLARGGLLLLELCSLAGVCSCWNSARSRPWLSHRHGQSEATAPQAGRAHTKARRGRRNQKLLHRHEQSEGFGSDSSAGRTSSHQGKTGTGAPRSQGQDPRSQRPGTQTLSHRFPRGAGGLGPGNVYIPQAWPTDSGTNPSTDSSTNRSTNPSTSPGTDPSRDSPVPALRCVFDGAQNTPQGRHTYDTL